MDDGCWGQQQQGQTLLAKAELVRTHAIDLPAQEKKGTSPGQPQ